MVKLESKVMVDKLYKLLNSMLQKKKKKKKKDKPEQDIKQL